MISNNQINDLLDKYKLPASFASLELENIEQKKVNINLNKSIIKLASDIFTNDLINYAKSGGDMKNLTVKNVYKKDKDNAALCWTSQKEYGMCVVDKTKKGK